METYEIECSGEIHEIGVDDEGCIHLLNHDVEEEETNAMLGDEVSSCYEMLDCLLHWPQECLWDAAHAGNLEHVKLAVACRADLYGKDCLVLQLAAANGYLEVVKYCIDKGIDFHKDNQLVLRRAIDGKNYEVAEYLLKLGAEAQAAGFQFVDACIVGDKKMVLLLLDFGLKLSELSFDDFMEILSSGQEEIVRIIYDRRNEAPANVFIDRNKSLYWKSADDAS